MNFQYDFNRATRLSTVLIKWQDGYTVLKAGTPLSRDGEVANNNNAYGLLMNDVTFQNVSLFHDGTLRTWATVMVAGYADAEKLPDLSANAKAALSGITFVSGKLTKELLGVKIAENVPEAAGEAPTAAEFKALLDALIEAGMMEEAPEVT